MNKAKNGAAAKEPTQVVAARVRQSTKAWLQGILEPPYTEAFHVAQAVEQYRARNEARTRRRRRAGAAS